MPGEVEMQATPIYCRHGCVTQWEGTAMPGDPLPEIEHCEQCAVVAVLGDVEEIAGVPGEFAQWVTQQIEQKHKAQEGDNT